jgi:type IV pilus assembly protein PilE
MKQFARPANRGFTLVEVMIVIAIAALLTAIALPAYREHLQRAKRAEARAGLLQAGQWLERVATATGVYLTDASQFPDSLTKVPSTAYVIAFQPKDVNGSGYALSAIPQGAQANDKCGTFTLDESGARKLADASASDALVAECWNR